MRPWIQARRKQFLNGDLVRYSPGVSYALQMGQSCIPCNFSYSGILEFDNIVRRLELDWWKIRAEVVQKVRNVLVGQFHQIWILLVEVI